MVIFTTSCIITEITPNCGIKEIMVKTPSTGESGDSCAINVAEYGISTSGLLCVHGFTQTTANSIVVEEEPTTAWASSSISDTLTITSGAGAGTKIFRILGRCS